MKSTRTRERNGIRSKKLNYLQSDMPSEPCSFTDYEEGICFDDDDPDFGSRPNLNGSNISFFVEGELTYWVTRFWEFKKDYESPTWAQYKPSG